MPDHARSIAELLKAIDLDQRFLPLMEWDVAEAFQAGLITSTEARHLQKFAHKTLGGQRKHLRNAGTPADREKLDRQIESYRAKFDELGPRLDELRRRMDADRDADE